MVDYTVCPLCDDKFCSGYLRIRNHLVIWSITNLFRKDQKNLNESSTRTQGVVCFYVLIPSKNDQAQSSFELANKTHLQQTECDGNDSRQLLLLWQHVLKWIVDRKQALIQKPTTVVVDVCLPRGVSFYRQKVLWTHSAFEEFAPDTKLSLLIRWWQWCYLFLCFLVFKPCSLYQKLELAHFLFRWGAWNSLLGIAL